MARAPALEMTLISLVARLHRGRVGGERNRDQYGKQKQKGRMRM